ncbi:MAG: cell division protein FtsZ [Cytophagaceae bacterium]|nr:cell division protein FtsZ [Cytophagaceae bacterium]MDW8455414.1 cell division protein FtsZ [Cytophagaceae bacterium]
MAIYNFEIPENKSIIKLIGVGGGGCNAVNYMYKQGIKDVEFLVCNTDLQHLRGCAVPNKLQIGVALTKGLGAGAYPEKGREAALENKEDIRDILSDGTKMLFITAGMGGGTGTGAAPVVAKIARELDILTIGIVTIPFKWEGPGKKKQALKGIEEMKESCDTVIIINNDKLQELFGKLEIPESFAKANDVLLTAAKSIAELITVQSEINVDFADVERVMKNSGAAVMGSAIAAGENRALKAIEQALYSPLIDNANIYGAKNILLSINYGEEAKFTMDELTEITDYIQQQVGEEADVIPGIGVDNSLGTGIRVTIIATGFSNSNTQNTTSKKIYQLDDGNQMKIFDDRKLSPTPYTHEDTTKKDVIFTKHEHKPETKLIIENEDKVIQTENHPQQESSIKQQEVKKANPIDALHISELNKEKLLKQAKERIERLKALNTQHYIDPQEFKQMLDVPAYLRKKIELKDNPHSSDSHQSRFTLGEDNEILGNNKFLHDNVD